MSKTGYYITEDGERVEFTTFNIFGTEEVDLSGERIVELILPDEAEFVMCHYNRLKSLKIPDSVLFMECDLMNGIEEQDRKGLEIWITST